MLDFVAEERSQLLGARPDEILLPGDIDEHSKRCEPLTLDSLALMVIALGVGFYALYSARVIMFPLTLAAFIALPLRPIMRWLSKWNMPRFLSAGILMGGCILCIISGIYWFATPAAEWLKDVPQKLGDAETKLRAFAKPLKEIDEATAQVEAIAATTEATDTVKVEVKQQRLSSAVLTATGDFAIGATISVSLAFLLLVFGDDLLKSIASALPLRRDRRQLEQMFFDAEHTVSQYLLTYTMINIALGLVIGTGLWLIGMPNPILWGVMAATLNYVPFLGLIVGTAVVSIVAILSFDSAIYACLAPAIYLIANGIEANIVTPTLLGRSMKLNTIAIFVAIVVFGWMWGIGGAIIAVPALAVMKAACDRSQRLSPIATILSG